MYSIEFAAKLVKIKRLCKNKVDKLRIFMVLSTYYLTFRLYASDPSDSGKGEAAEIQQSKEAIQA